MRIARLMFALLLAAPVAAQAEAARYELDPVHTRVLFTVSHAGFSNAIGTVSGSTGDLWFDAQDWRSARLQARVPVARVDLGDAKWNAATLAGNLLDAEDHPVATFVSTRVEPVDAQRASVFGTLTLRGVSQEVKLDVTLNAAKRHPLPPFRRTVGFSATTTLSRKAFGIEAWPSVIGDAVELRIEAEAVRARGAADDATPGDDVPVEDNPLAPAPEPVPTPASEPAPQPAPPPTPAPPPDDATP